MKRFRIIMLSVVLCVIFTGCKGTISNDVEIDYGVSTKYSRLELEEAVNVIKKDFVRSIPRLYDGTFGVCRG